MLDSFASGGAHGLGEVTPGSGLERVTESQSPLGHDRVRFEEVAAPSPTGGAGALRAPVLFGAKSRSGLASAPAWLFVAFWAFLCLLIVIALWVSTFSRIERMRAETIARANERARSAVNAYQGFVERSVKNSDQLLEIVRYRSMEGGIDLGALKERAGFRGQDWLGVAILDANAHCVSASFGCDRRQSFEFREYFQFHRDHPEDVAHLGLAVAGINGGPSHPTVIHLSRRIVDANGRFAGVAVIALLEPYFTQFFTGSSLSDPDFLAVMGEDGIVRALRVGHADVDTAGSAIKMPAAMRGKEGSTQLQPGEWAASPQSSLIAWKRLDQIPMYALVGLSEDHVLAAWAESRQSALHQALLWTLVLIALGGLSSVLALRFVSKRVREERIRAAYRVATEGTRDGLSFLEPLYDSAHQIADLAFADCNEAAASMLGMTRHRLVGRRCAELLDPEGLARTLLLFERAATAGHLEFTQAGCALGPLDPDTLWVEHRIVRTGLGFAVTLRDVTEGVVHRDQLAQMANEDRLTGLPNRNWLETEVGEMIRARAGGLAQFALLFVDFDGFKRVNDSMGHSAGDELLRAAAKRLAVPLGPEDSVVRLGGDEFVILVRSAVSEAPVAELANQIVASFQTPFCLAPGEVKIGVSIGICLYPEHGVTMEELLRNADLAMYEEKASRRGKFRFFRPELFSAVQERFEMEGALLSAIDRNEFVLHFQPQFAIDSGQLIGFEALVRWVRAGRGLILPADFVPVAEEAGLITRLGEQVIEKACQQLATWRALELPVVPVSVNVSAIQFHHSNIRKTFETALARYRVPPQLIQMEITESSMIGNEAAISAMLQQIRGLGIKISVDDFGTGYSSLSQLQQLRVDAIKIDRSFISAMQASAEGEVFVRAIISMAHALAMKVVAEGVETASQLESLRRLQCEAAQGFYFSKPLAGALATDLLLDLSEGRRAPLRPGGTVASMPGLLQMPAIGPW
jgi:diguanylate cyclase (GGDEF)-like protein